MKNTFLVNGNSVATLIRWHFNSHSYKAELNESNNRDKHSQIQKLEISIYRAYYFDKITFFACVAHEIQNTKLHFIRAKRDEWVKRTNRVRERDRER